MGSKSSQIATAYRKIQCGQTTHKMNRRSDELCRHALDVGRCDDLWGKSSSGSLSAEMMTTLKTLKLDQTRNIAIFRPKSLICTPNDRLNIVDPSHSEKQPVVHLNSQVNGDTPL